MAAPASVETALPLASAILAAIDRHATILTPNQRSARTLHRAFELHQRALGRTQWTPPAIFALDTWLPTLWHRLIVTGAESHVLLNPAQEHALWRAIIASDREVSGLRSPDVLADLAARAFQLLWLYNARLDDTAVSTDTRAFARWMSQFERANTRDLYLTHAQLPAALEEALSRGDLDLPAAGLALVDFDQYSPAIASLLNSIERAGYEVEKISTAISETRGQLHPIPDAPTELRTAARWARTLLAANPRTRIAIVVPNLADRRPEIERTFAEMLPPEAFEFSLGRPLAETSLASTFLDLLRWSLEPLPLDRITAVLLSPHFAAQSEPLAEFDAYDLRKSKALRPELSLDDTIDLLAKSPRKSRLAQLHARLRALRKAAATNLTGAEQSHAHWADVFRTILESAAPAPDSITYQTLRRWESALDTLSTLDFNATRLTAPEALQTLRRITTQTIFAPESANAPIQIVGPLELGGAPFDALWLLSADDRTWPIPPALNPLLPWQIQRTHSMPGADPARDTARAQTLTHRIAASATQVVVSYATHAEDGPRRPSPLLRALNLAPVQSQPEEQPTPIPLDVHTDTTALPELPAVILTGGAIVLERQAACAFRAFAERRLHSTEPDACDPGLDHRDRGSLVHTVMQAFWTHLKTQQALRDLTPAARLAFLDQCIDQALSRAQRQVRAPWDAAYLEVQRRRLQQLLAPWLQTEIDRPPFEVLATEQKVTAAIGPLTLSLRVDRIDLTPAGTLILDYKTGAATPADWLSDRPDAPQLPLYAVLATNLGAPGLASETWDGITSVSPESNDAPSPLAGVAFALLRAGEDLDLRGFADTPDVFGKTAKMARPTLQAQLEDWHGILEKLAYAFADGDPAPLPSPIPRPANSAPSASSAASTPPPSPSSATTRKRRHSPMPPSLQLVPPPVLADAETRALALDTARSFIVEAPAGSGKTALLLQRFLKLLALVDAPGQVLAITFTRKATAELLDRILEPASKPLTITPNPQNDLDRQTRPLAEVVLARDEALGWDLLDHPHRLNVRTIDAFALDIAAGLPILSNSGGAQSPEPDPEPLYAEAAHRTLMQLGGPDHQLNRALETILLHRDGNLDQVQKLIAGMLAQRDQWGELIPLAAPHLEDSVLDLEVLPKFERVLDLAICRGLTALEDALPAGLLDQLALLGLDIGHSEHCTGSSPDSRFRRSRSLERPH